MVTENESKKNIMDYIAEIIVRYRFLFMLLFVAAAIFCALSLGKTKINSDITSFLPDTTDTRRGLSIMNEEFIILANEKVMVANITYEKAEELAESIRGFDCVSRVEFDKSERHYKNASALLSIYFSATESDPGVEKARVLIRQVLAPYDTYTYSLSWEGYDDELAREMVGILAISSAVIIIILTITSRSYFEVVIISIVFFFAALLNMGTNYWLGEISSITKSIAIILQLALAIDYAIIFIHRYQDETEIRSSTREAVTNSLSKAIIEISSSSLTTIAGLVALMFMQFRLGYDLGTVLAKGIVCSMLTVFLLMPGLLLLFPGAIRRSAHKNLIPDISPWGRFLSKSAYCFVWLFLLIIPAAIICSGRTVYAFDNSAVTELVYSENREAMHKIRGTFAYSTHIAVIVPAEDFDKEKELLQRLEELEGITSANGLANIEIDNNHVLTDSVNPRMLADLLGIRIEEATLLFQAYGIKNEQYQSIFGQSENYEVPLINLFLFLFDILDKGVVSPDKDKLDEINQLRGSLEDGVKYLRGKEHNRFVLSADIPAEGEESIALVQQIKDIAEEIYAGEEVLVIGDITSARDLRDSYSGDSRLISFLTVFFVFIILLFTFKTFVGAAVLVFVIQGAIWINFSFPYLQNSVPFFVTSMIVSAIQMGATIDYAIVLMNRYLTLRSEMPKREAIVSAVNQSFVTVITSGSIMAVAGLIISKRVSDVYVGHIGLAVGRGAIISVILVLTVLPQLILLLDKAIEKTTFTIRMSGGEDID